MIFPASRVPLRPEFGSVEHSELYAGYCPPRGDFFDEPDPPADKILNNVIFDVDDLDPLDRSKTYSLKSLCGSQLSEYIRKEPVQLVDIFFQSCR